ncbi:MAG: efflux RND transporter periplasmic adaptor subunit [Deltaproteobacteria bacterium]|nr:efflux RND transporter periplasmic adaptor subunit [Deltaproteobacteria bacterium]
MNEQRRRAVTALGIIAAGLLLAILTAGCKGEPEKATVKRPEISGVTVAVVSSAPIDSVYETTGTVRSDRTSLVASRAMGAVTSLLVREGDWVRAGQLLLTIDDRDASERVRAARMALESAKQNMELSERTWQRYKNLYEAKALTRQEIDQIETQKNVAAADYQRVQAMAGEARTYQSFTRVTAPVAGRVTEKRIDVGSMANPGMPLLIIEGGGNSYIEAAIDAGMGDKIKTGMNVQAAIETIEQPAPGVIREVLPAVDPLSRTFIIKVGLKDLRPRSGLFARIRIPVGKRDGILVPDQAVIQKGQLTGVYAVDSQGIVTYRLVRTGPASAGYTEILSGLGPGDRIVAAGAERVIDGGIIAGAQSK